MLVGFLFTLVLRLVPFFEMFIPREGKVLSVAVSTAEFIEGCLELRTSLKAAAAEGPGMIASVLLTYLL